MVTLHVSAYAESTSLGVTLPTVNAMYITTQCEVPCIKPLKKQWWLMRIPNQVELRDVDSESGQLTSLGELWKRAPDGKMTYWYLMHDDKRVIEYLFDDLKVLGIKTDESQWQMLTQIISDYEKSILKLHTAGSEPFLGYAAERFTGVINGINVELIWLSDLHVPAMVEYQYPKRTVKVQLIQIQDRHISSSAGKFPTKTDDVALSQYQHIYYTDIGDMEQNDEAKEWLVRAITAPGLHTNHHH